MRIAAAILALASAGATLTATAVPAFAGQQHSVTIEYSDLNLNSPAGRAALERRVAQASRKVCGQPLTPRLGLLPVMECRAETTAEALSQVQLQFAASGQVRAAR